MNKIALRVAITLIAALPVGGFAQSTFSLVPQVSDGTVYPGGIDNINQTSAMVGLRTTTGYGRAGVFVFSLPKIPFGDTIQTATLSLKLVGYSGSGLTFNGDLYSLGVRQPSAILASDYFNGTYGSDPHAVALEQHFLTPGLPVGRVTASASGSDAIASDIQGYLDAGSTAGSYYFLRLNPDFATPTSATQSYNISTADDSRNLPALTLTTAPPPQLGRVLIEYWSNLSGGDSIASLMTDTNNFGNAPSSREYPTVMEIPQVLSAIPGGATDIDFGDRLRGIFYPTVTGNYTFAIASDDASALLLSTDATAAHATTIATVTAPGSTYYHQWNKYASQTSTPVYLVAGTGYYIEAQHKQAGGGANMSVGYMPPGTSSIALMPATDVAPFDPMPAYSSSALQAAMSTAHPRLMLSEAEIDRLYSAIHVNGSVQATWWASIQAQANTIMGEQPIIVNTTTGDFVNQARDLQDRVYYLSLDYLLCNDTTTQANCLSTIYTLLTDVAQWKGYESQGWLCGATDATPAFLDVAEISHAFAIAYDWCYAGWTPAQRAYICSTLSTQGLAVGVSQYNAGNTWVKNTALGNGVCVSDSAMTFSSIAILGEEAGAGVTAPSAPTMLDDCMTDFSVFAQSQHDVLANDGGWAESECYWNFAMRYMSTLLASLETSTGTCYDIDHLGGLAETGAYELYTFSPISGSAGTLFVYGDEEQPDVGASDGSGGPGYPSPLQKDQGLSRALQYFGLKYDQPVYSWRQQQTIALNAVTPSPYPTDLLWYDPRGATESPSALDLPPSTYFANDDELFLRSAWNDPNALYVGMKGGWGVNSSPYGHGDAHLNLDIGTFVFDALGVRWAYGLGRDTYNKYYFDLNLSDYPNRYSYYRSRSEGQNTLVINPSSDGGQSETSNAPVISFVSNSTTQQGIIDMTSAYVNTTSGSTTVVKTAKRGMRLISGVAQLQDEVTTNSATNVDLNWFMHTTTTITQVNPTTMRLTSGNDVCDVVIQSPLTATFSGSPGSPSQFWGVLSNVAAAPMIATGSPNPSDQDPNSGVRKLRIELNIPPTLSNGQPVAQTTTVTVALCPYVNTGSAPTPPAVIPLSSW
jgi:hypothetical protein